MGCGNSVPSSGGPETLPNSENDGTTGESLLGGNVKLKRALTVIKSMSEASQDSMGTDPSVCSRDSSAGVSTCSSVVGYAVFQSPDLTPGKHGFRRTASFGGGSGSPDTSHLSGVQAVSIKGQKADSPNQDSWIVMRSGSEFSVYGVFDGHGKMGHVMSAYVKRNLCKMILDDPRLGQVPTPKVVKEAFARVTALIAEQHQAGKLPALNSGTTATVVVHDHGKKDLTIAHIGDSGCALATGSSFKAKYLTPDHKPNCPEEAKRIVRVGGAITKDSRNFRVHKKAGYGPMLNMSRCFGDLWGQACGIISQPDIIQLHIHKADQVLLLCSDGVWEYMTPQDAADTAHDALRSQADGAAHAVAIKAMDRWNELHETTDDITVVLVKLQEQPGSSSHDKKLRRADSAAHVGRLKRSDSKGSIGSGASNCTASGSIASGSSGHSGDYSARSGRLKSAMRHSGDARVEGTRHRTSSQGAVMSEEHPCDRASFGSDYGNGGDLSRRSSMSTSAGCLSARDTSADDAFAIGAELGEVSPKVLSSIGIRRARGYFADPVHNDL
mmetsp:Transcript_63596/g.184463  ORF Transcript_63596/g.184463 Transcript_63596/m.184463 type:complete len:554 (+) Transcript_63596:124-1785(+)